MIEFCASPLRIAYMQSTIVHTIVGDPFVALPRELYVASATALNMTRTCESSLEKWVEYYVIGLAEWQRNVFLSSHAK